MNSRITRRLKYKAKNEKKPTLHMISSENIGDYLNEEYNHKEGDRIRSAIVRSHTIYGKGKYTKKYADKSQKVKGYKLRPVKQEVQVEEIN